MNGPRVIVIGAGITGLSAAVTLQAEARRIGTRLDLMVLERNAYAGGHARTTQASGFVIEAGPNGFLNREPETLALIDLLQLQARVITADAATARRFIVRDGRLCEVPTSPRSLLTTRALSWRGKARLLAEPWAAGPPGTEETVHAFAERRIGSEAADILVDTAVSGISAGDSRRLSVQAQFPLMVEMERDHGSLFRAMFARRRARSAPWRLLSFDAGIGVLPQAIAAQLGTALATEVNVIAIARDARGWTVRLEDGRVIEGDHLVIATPARVAATLLRDVDEALADALTEVVAYAGVAVVGLGYRAADLPRPLAGYGYLVTRREGLATLGVVWESSLFAGRAPEGHVLVRAILGGTRVPEAAERSEADCVQLARTELARVMGLHADPVHTSVHRWPHAIAQYTVGHGARVERLRQRVAVQAGLHLCGTSYDGVSFNHAVKSGRMMARTLANTFWHDGVRSPGLATAERVAV
jgi:oxygen-dependent protoporphyrinogen oxidase